MLEALLHHTSGPRVLQSSGQRTRDGRPTVTISRFAEWRNAEDGPLVAAASRLPAIEPSRRPRSRASLRTSSLRSTPATGERVPLPVLGVSAREHDAAFRDGLGHMIAAIHARSNGSLALVADDADGGVDDDGESVADEGGGRRGGRGGRRAPRAARARVGGVATSPRIWDDFFKSFSAEAAAVRGGGDDEAKRKAEREAVAARSAGEAEAKTRREAMLASAAGDEALAHAMHTHVPGAVQDAIAAKLRRLREDGELRASFDDEVEARLRAVEAKRLAANVAVRHNAAAATLRRNAPDARALAHSETAELNRAQLDAVNSRRRAADAERAAAAAMQRAGWTTAAEAAEAAAARARAREVVATLSTVVALGARTQRLRAHLAATKVARRLARGGLMLVRSVRAFLLRLHLKRFAAATRLIRGNSWRCRIRARRLRRARSVRAIREFLAAAALTPAMPLLRFLAAARQSARTIQRFHRVRARARALLVAQSAAVLEGQERALMAEAAAPPAAAHCAPAEHATAASHAGGGGGGGAAEPAAAAPSPNVIGRVGFGVGAAASAAAAAAAAAAGKPPAAGANVKAATAEPEPAAPPAPNARALQASLRGRPRVAAEPGSLEAHALALARARGAGGVNADVAALDPRILLPRGTREAVVREELERRRAAFAHAQVAHARMVAVHALLQAERAMLADALELACAPPSAMLRSLPHWDSDVRKLLDNAHAPAGVPRLVSSVGLSTTDGEYARALRRLGFDVVVRAAASVAPARDAAAAAKRAAKPTRRLPRRAVKPSAAEIKANGRALGRTSTSSVGVGGATAAATGAAAAAGKVGGGVGRAAAGLPKAMQPRGSLSIADYQALAREQVQKARDAAAELELAAARAVWVERSGAQTFIAAVARARSSRARILALRLVMRVSRRAQYRAVRTLTVAEALQLAPSRAFDPRRDAHPRARKPSATAGLGRPPPPQVSVTAAARRRAGKATSAVRAATRIQAHVRRHAQRARFRVIGATLETPAHPLLALRFTRERAIVLLLRAQERVRALRDEEGVPTAAERDAAVADIARWRRAVHVAKRDAVLVGEEASAMQGMRRAGRVVAAATAFSVRPRHAPKPVAVPSTADDEWSD